MVLGNVLLCKGWGIFGKLVRLGNLIHYGESGYAHACIIGDKKPGYFLVYEALGKGFTTETYGGVSVSFDFGGKK